MDENKDKNVISMREVQRNYKKIFDRAKRTKKPVFLGAHFKPSIVVLDINSFEYLKRQAKTKKKTNWGQFYINIDKISKKGCKDVNLSEFIIKDRESR